MDAEISKKDELMKKMSKQLQARSDEISRILYSKEELQMKVRSLKETAHGIGELKETYEKKILQKEEVIEILQAQLVAKDREIAKVHKKKEKLKMKYSSAKLQVEEVKVAGHSHAEESARKDEIILSLRKQLRSKDKEITMVQQQREEAIMESMKLKEKTNNTRQNVEDARAKAYEEVERKDQLITLLKTAQKKSLEEISKLKNEIVTLESKRNAMHYQVGMHMKDKMNKSAGKISEAV